ncbi:MAG TPA: UxaA family hydrolase, partial [Pirellulales bacterium]|nr:UxaA family hydrolase [Pirellulales bacterium]
MYRPTPAIDVVVLNPADNVCVAARALDAGNEIDAAGRQVKLHQAVRLGHKIALVPIVVGQAVVKYGQTIGFATQAIAAGEWVHSHNLAAGQFTRDHAKSTDIPPDPTPLAGKTFLGYPRAGRRAGTRNYIAVISTVNCSASVSRYVARRFDRETLRRDFPNVDGVVAFTHGSGCGMPYKGLNHQVLNRVMAGIARHPNIGGYLLIGLGCETATIGALLEEHHLVQIAGVPGKPIAASSAGAGRPLVLS